MPDIFVTAAGPWTLSWEFVLALVTLLLALFTGWLAWTTRRLARATAEEVQGQIRPVLVPARDMLDVSNEEPSAGGDARGYITLTIQLKNIGAGPALDFELSAGAGSYGGSDFGILEPGKEAAFTLTIPVYDEGGIPFTTRTSRITVKYQDLGGRVFTTSFFWVVTGFGNPARINPRVLLTAGVAPRDAPTIGPASYENPLLPATYTRRPNRYQLRDAWSRYMVQAPEEVPAPFLSRLHRTWRALYPRRRSSRFQRIAWGLRAYRYTLDKPIPPYAPRGTGLPRLYVRARGWKWMWLTYWRMS